MSFHQPSESSDVTKKRPGSAVSPDAVRFMEQQIPFNALLGIEIDSVGDGKARLRIPFRPELIGDPWRPAIHGGVISALADTAGGAAVFSRFVNPSDRASTVDLRIDYLRPGDKATLMADATVIRMGNRVAVVDVIVYHAGRKEKPIATAKAVYNIRRGKGS